MSGDVHFGNHWSKYGDKLYAQLTVNGGRVAVGGAFYLTSWDNGKGNFSIPGCIVLNDGVIDVRGGVDMGRNTAYSDNYESFRNHYGIYLNGGVFKVENVTRTAQTAKSKFYFNGGVYAPYGANEANRTMQNLNVCYVSEGGAVVSTENLPADATYTIAQPLLTDPALSGAADGGLVKKGAGVLELTGANTFTGPTKVEEGVLAASVASALSSSVAVADGAGLYTPDGTTLSFTDAAASGAIKADSVTVTDSLKLAAPGSVLSVVGGLTFANSTAIDFGLAEGETPSSDWIPVAAASGTLTAPQSLRAINAGPYNRCFTSVVDGVLYVKPTSQGFSIIIR